MRTATPTRTSRKYSFSVNSRVASDIPTIRGAGEKPRGFARRDLETLIGRDGVDAGVSETDREPGFGGNRVILALYAIVVTVAGLMGAVIGSIGLRDLEAVTFLGLVTFRPTPFGLAAFGVATIGTLLGTLLVLVVVVSRRYA